MSTPDLRRDDAAALFTLLYVSELVADSAAVAQICRQSRVNNERDEITGVLVFDGHAFCQFVEGAEAVVGALRDRLERDPRHTRMQVLQFGRTPGPRRFGSWRLGFAYSADPAAIGRIASNRGGAALAAFGDWIPGLSANEASEG
jgi:hypothetical protein